MREMSKKIQKFYSEINIEKPDITTVDVDNIEINVDVPVEDAFEEILKKIWKKDSEG